MATDDSGFRLKRFLNTEMLEQKYVADKINVSKQYINSICSGRINVSKKIADRLQEEINVSAAWLLTGDGPMYALMGDHTPTAAEQTEPLPVTQQQPSATARPYFDIDFTASFNYLENDQTVNPEFFIDFPPYRSCDYYCSVHGNSMEPTISSGDIVALKRIEDFSYLINGKIYAIVTSNGLRTIKRIRDNGDTFALVPDNPAVGEQLIPKSFVTHVYLVMGSIKQF